MRRLERSASLTVAAWRAVLVIIIIIIIYAFSLCFEPFGSILPKYKIYKYNNNNKNNNNHHHHQQQHRRHHHHHHHCTSLALKTSTFVACCEGLNSTRCVIALKGLKVQSSRRSFDSTSIRLRASQRVVSERSASGQCELQCNESIAQFRRESSLTNPVQSRPRSHRR